MIDMEYITSGIFTNFTPITKAGEAAWNELAAQNDGCGRVFSIHKHAVIVAMRAAGLKVSKGKLKTVRDLSDKDLKELGI